MKFLRLDLLTLLISLFILGSCKNQNEVGLPVGDQQLDGTLMVYDDINVKTLAEDTANTTGLAKTPLADLNDPRLGRTQADIATGINLPGTAAYTVPAGTITTDSVILELRYADGFYGDSLSSKYKINVFQLAQSSKPTGDLYYSNKVWNRLTDNWVSTNAGPYNVRPNTKVKVTDIRAAKADTVISMDPHLRVPLQASKFTNFLFTAANVTSNATFQNAIRGLYLTVERSQASQSGGALMFDLSTSAVKVYYRANNSGTIDTGVATLALTNYSAPIKHTYSTEVNTALAGNTSADAFYVQGLAGLRTKVSFPNIKTMFGNVDLKTIAINRAELVISPDPGTEFAPFIPQPQLTLYRYGITLQRQQVPDANGSSTTIGDPRFFGAAVFGGNYITAKKEYHFVLTGYIQDLVSGKLTDYGTYIGAIDSTTRTTQVAIAPTIQTAGRLIATGSKKTSPYRIKLNVIYTKNN